jgi:hypothetical protein
MPATSAAMRLRVLPIARVTILAFFFSLAIALLIDWPLSFFLAHSAAKVVAAPGSAPQSFTIESVRGQLVLQHVRSPLDSSVDSAQQHATSWYVRFWIPRGPSSALTSEMQQSSYAGFGGWTTLLPGSRPWVQRVVAIPHYLLIPCVVLIGAFVGGVRPHWYPAFLRRLVPIRRKLTYSGLKSVVLPYSMALASFALLADSGWSLFQRKEIQVYPSNALSTTRFFIVEICDHPGWYEIHVEREQQHKAPDVSNEADASAGLETALAVHAPSARLTLSSAWRGWTEHWSTSWKSDVIRRRDSTLFVQKVTVAHWIPITVFAVLAWLTSGHLRSQWRKRRRVTKGLCGCCAYDLRAHFTSAAKCPECGTPVPDSQSSHAVPPSNRP